MACTAVAGLGPVRKDAVTPAGLAQLAPAEEKDERGVGGGEDLTGRCGGASWLMTGRSARRVRARPVPPEPRVLGDPVAR